MNLKDTLAAVVNIAGLDRTMQRLKFQGNGLRTILQEQALTGPRR